MPLIKPDLPELDDISSAFRTALASGRITNFGPHLQEFERGVEEFVGRQAVALSSGTMALLFVLKGLGVGPGSRVALPSFTFVATAQAIEFAGAVPVFVEIGEDLTIDATDLSNVLAREQIDVVLGVHMYGLPCREDELRECIRNSGQSAKLVFDGAHAFGSERAGRRVGGMGDAEIFSLSVTKVLVSVEGGLVATSDPDLAHRIRKMRNYGIEANYDAWYAGLNGKMSELHAIVGVANLRRLPELMKRRQERARYYRQRVVEETQFSLTSWPEEVVHTFKDFSVFLPEGREQLRPQLISWLEKRGIETRAYFYPPVHEQRFFRKYSTRPLPVTERLARSVLTLPFYTTITDDEIAYVVENVRVAQQEVLGMVKQ